MDSEIINGTAITVHDGRQPADDGPVKLGKIQEITVPAALLLAAESVTGEGSNGRNFLSGIFLHSKKGAKITMGRIVATDGGRMFMASFDLPAEANKEGSAPAWLRKGLLLDRDNLRAKVNLLTKLDSSEASVRIAYSENSTHAELSDPHKTAVFRQSLLEATFPDYDRVLAGKSFTDLDDDGNPVSRDWQPIGLNSKYLKQVGDIAKQLESGLPKDARSKAGMVVRAFNGGDPASPMVFDFDTWPGALLVIMPAITPTAGISKETAQLLAPAIRQSVAALKAHATRNDEWGKQEEDPVKRAAFEAKAADFRRRVEELISRLPGAKQIAKEKAPEPKPQPDPDSESDNAEQDAADAVRKSADPAESDEDGGAQATAAKVTTRRRKVPVKPATQDNGAGEQAAAA